MSHVQDPSSASCPPRAGSGSRGLAHRARPRPDPTRATAHRTRRQRLGRLHAGRDRARVGEPDQRRRSLLALVGRRRPARPPGRAPRHARHAGSAGHAARRDAPGGDLGAERARARRPDHPRRSTRGRRDRGWPRGRGRRTGLPGPPRLGLGGRVLRRLAARAAAAEPGARRRGLRGRGDRQPRPTAQRLGHDLAAGAKPGRPARAPSAGGPRGRGGDRGRVAAGGARFLERRDLRRPAGRGPRLRDGGALRQRPAGRAGRGRDDAGALRARAAGHHRGQRARRSLVRRAGRARHRDRPHLVRAPAGAPAALLVDHRHASRPRARDPRRPARRRLPRHEGLLT